MDACSLGALVERRAAVDEELAAVRVALRKSKLKQSRDARQWALTVELQRMVLMIYIMADYALAPATFFLKRCAKERHWTDKTDAELDAFVEELFLKANVIELASMTDITEPADESSLAAALNAVEQWRLAAWGRDLNVRCGVAPSTRAVLSRMHANLSKLPDVVRPPAVGNVKQVSARKWAQRWRVRFGARCGILSTRALISLGDMRAKARVGFWLSE